MLGKGTPLLPQKCKVLKKAPNLQKSLGFELLLQEPPLLVFAGVPIPPLLCSFHPCLLHRVGQGWVLENLETTGRRGCIQALSQMITADNQPLVWL